MNGHTCEKKLVAECYNVLDDGPIQVFKCDICNNFYCPISRPITNRSYCPFGHGNLIDDCCNTCQFTYDLSGRSRTYI